MAQRITIADVAREAGVSPMTVSNVLNDAGRMRPNTRNRVEKAIEKLGYHANRSAQMLRTGSTGMIGLAMPGFNQPFTGLFCDVVSRLAHKQGYGLVITTYEDKGGSLEDIIDETYKLNADGWIFFANQPLKDHGAILNQHYPVVLVGDFSAYGQTDAVVMPNVEAAKYATNWLYEHGGETVAFVGAPPEIFDEAGGVSESVIDRIDSFAEGNTTLRLKGYIEAHRERGAEVDWQLVQPIAGITREEGEAAMARMLEGGSHPSAVFCVNDAVAIGALAAVERRSLRVPDDIQIVGFDNTRDALFTVPTLTTIDPDIERYAEYSVDRLLKRIEDKQLPSRVLTTNFSLVERESTR